MEDLHPHTISSPNWEVVIKPLPLLPWWECGKKPSLSWSINKKTEAGVEQKIESIEILLFF